jgi:tetratricopeptide (TPR) repeat protein
MIWRYLILSVALPSAFAGSVEDALDKGSTARADGVPQAAIYELTRAANRVSGPDASKVVVELARCLLEAGREPEAVEWTQKPAYRDQPAVVFWRAQAQAQRGDYVAALADYESAGRLAPEFRVDAQFGAARMLEALGRFPEALEIYLRIPKESDRYVPSQLASAAIHLKIGHVSEAKRLLDALKPSQRDDKDLREYFLARIDLESGRAAEARKTYERLEPRDPELSAGAIIGRAEAHSRSGDEDKADSVLESFVRENPRNALIERLMAKFDEIQSREKDPLRTSLKQWERDDDNPALSAAASYYLARSDERQGRLDRAMREYGEFIEQQPGHSLRVSAIVRLARLQLGAGQADAAAKLLAGAGELPDRGDEARVLFLLASAKYQIGEFGEAAKAFVRAANLDPSLSEPALANAGLAAIGGGSEPLAAEILNALRKENATEARRIELAQAMASAREGAPDAGEQLAWVANQGGAAGNRARLALAEWRWGRGNLPGAKSEYHRVANSGAAGSGDQKDYFADYLADDGSIACSAAVAQGAQDFLARHPDSPHEAAVRMKWGEVLARSGDYRRARVQFEEAAASTTDAALRQSALFLAARAAAKSMAPEELGEAISLFERVAEEKSGDLATRARWEQAMLQSALGHYEDSVSILDRILATTTDVRLRFAARLKKGDALFAQAGSKPGPGKDAIKEWRAIVNAPDVLPSERNEALTHIGAAHEQSGDHDAALSAYYEVLESPRDKQPEFFWYYKAGFAAAELLHKDKRFKEEAAIYEKMAAVPGPRADEARDSVKRLRLENFIWKD